MSDTTHRWKVTKLVGPGEVPSVREVDAESPIHAVEASFERSLFHVIPSPTCDYLGADVWMVTVAGFRYLAIAPFPAF